MVALVLDGLVGFPAGLSPTSFHLFPSSFHLSPRLGAVVRFPAGLSPLRLSPTFSPNSNISIHVFPRFVTAGVRPFPLVFSAGHVAFLFICLPRLSLLVSALFRWPCSISIHLSPRSVTAGVRPFLLAM